MIIRRYMNWLNHKLNIRENIMGLRFTTTWNCDSRCITCSIWKIPNAGVNDLTLEEIDRFSRSKYLKNVEYITFSGGEPTLRKDLPGIFTTLHRNIPKATFGITTHGMHPDREEEIFRKTLKDNPGIKIRLVGISLNGPPEVHDKTRGIDGCWQKAVETYDRLKDLVPCQFSFTFCRDNVEHFDWVQDFAKEKGTKAYICWTVMNERFNVSDKDLVFWQKGMEKVLEKHVERIAKMPKNAFEKFISMLLLPFGITLSCLYDNIINRRIMPCYGGSQIVHIDPQGKVYPCNFKLSEDRILGDLRQKSFDEIWESVPDRILKEIEQGECMYPNGLCGDSDIYPSICNAPPFVLKWYVNKLLKKRPLVEISEDD